MVHGLMCDCAYRGKPAFSATAESFVSPIIAGVNLASADAMQAPTSHGAKQLHGPLSLSGMATLILHADEPLVGLRAAHFIASYHGLTMQVPGTICPCELMAFPSFRPL